MAIYASQDILNGQRQQKPKHEYAVPRYRVTLVRDNRAVPPSSPLNTSLAAAAILRPLFVGLDREHFLVCGLDQSAPCDTSIELGYLPYDNPFESTSRSCGVTPPIPSP